MGFDWHSIQIPLPVLLAATATLGYMVGRRRRSGETCPRCKQEAARPRLKPSPLPTACNRPDRAAAKFPCPPGVTVPIEQTRRLAALAGRFFASPAATKRRDAASATSGLQTVIPRIGSLATPRIAASDAACYHGSPSVETSHNGSATTLVR